MFHRPRWFGLTFDGHKKAGTANSDYQSFIKAKHERFFNTPQSIVETAIQKATGSCLADKRRIVKGEANEVYAVKTQNGLEVFIRISRNGGSGFHFEKEGWAIEQCAKVGISVPEVLYVGTAQYENKPLGISVAKRLPGIALDEFAAAISNKELAHVLRKAGAVLSRIHSIKTNGFGELHKDGNGEHQSVTEMFSKRKVNRERLFAMARGASLDVQAIQQAMEVLEDYQSQYPFIAPRLIHGDFAPKHILVSGGEIAGILDFEEAHGGDPIEDLARWKFFFEGRYPLEQLLEGYGDQPAADSDFERRLYIWKFRASILNLDYYLSEGNQSGIDFCKDRLAENMRHFIKH